MKNDTIVAVSTPPGVGGLAVLRLSGPDALPIALRHLSAKTLVSRHATFCRLDDLDEVVALYLPSGYSGEPTVEISCHGSIYVQQTAVQLFIDDGARLAEPGEFTQRAFLNGRIDLSQAEAVADLIESVTPTQHRLAVSQLRGGYAKKLKELRQQLLDLTTLLELELDFSQEDLEFADRTTLRQLLSHLTSHVSCLIDSFTTGNALKRGIPVAIIGKPNVGKSSLLNMLLGDERAIVSPQPGTTRDTIEETFTLGGMLFRFIDTAGIRKSTDSVENMGIERSLHAMDNAQLVLYVHDITTPWEPPTLNLTGKQVIVVMNKSDLPHDDSPLISQFSPLYISAKTGDGIPALRDAMLAKVMETMPRGDESLLTNVRHYEALKCVNHALGQVALGLDEAVPADLLAVDLRDALHHLGTITGEVTTEELLDNIFGRFCIGK